MVRKAENLGRDIELTLVLSVGESDSVLSEKTKDETASIATETEKKLPPTTKNIAREVSSVFSALDNNVLTDPFP